MCARPQARWRLPFRSSGFSCHLFVYLILETKQAFPSNMRNGSHNIYVSEYNIQRSSIHISMRARFLSSFLFARQSKAKNLAGRLICLPSTEFFLAIWENFLVGFPFKTLSTWRSCTSNLNSQKIRLLSMNSLMKLWKFIFKYKRSLIATLFFFFKYEMVS